MSCSLQHDSTHSNGVTTTITISTKDALTPEERNLLDRHIWKWAESQCIEPLSVKIEELKA